MKLRVDQSCAGHGRCYILAPELLEDDDQGYVTIRGGEIEVPADQVEAAREVAESCPELAIILIEDQR